MPFFTARLKTSQGGLTFYFNRIYTVEGVRYHVSVVGPDGKVHAFNVYYQEEKWKLVNSDNCPDWIVEIENEISNAIKRHQSEPG